MKILYLSYWSIDDGLTQSSVLPALKVLSNMEFIDKVIFCTIERAHNIGSAPAFPKLKHIPLVADRSAGMFSKIRNFIVFPLILRKIMAVHQIDQMICRSTPSGSLGYLACRGSNTSFVVESFEPHADYMLDAGAWTRNGLKYRFQKYWERQIIKHSSYLITVSRHYEEYLKKNWKIKCVTTFACAVDLDRFQYSENERDQFRVERGWQDNFIGIYVGKFGDIYYDRKAFDIIDKAFRFFGENFRLIILSPQNSDEILMKLEKNSGKVWISNARHEDVPKFLSAADFAFSFVRPAPIRKFCSPIKDGEYWANGLPILSPPDIGEDSDIIEMENGGAIFQDDLSDLDDAFGKVHEMIPANRINNKYVDLAHKYRSFNKLPSIYIQSINHCR